jgi:hypothetical protein
VLVLVESSHHYGVDQVLEKSVTRGFLRQWPSVKGPSVSSSWMERHEWSHPSFKARHVSGSSPSIVDLSAILFRIRRSSDGRASDIRRETSEVVLTGFDFLPPAGSHASVAGSEHLTYWPVTHRRYRAHVCLVDPMAIKLVDVAGTPHAKGSSAADDSADHTREPYLGCNRRNSGLHPVFLCGNDDHDS